MKDILNHVYYENNKISIVGNIWQTRNVYMINVEIKPVDCVGGFDILTNEYDSINKAIKAMNKYVSMCLKKLNGGIEYAKEM